MALSISYPYRYSYSWFQTLSKVSGVCPYHLEHPRGRILSWLETLSPNWYVFPALTGSHQYAFEILSWSWCLPVLFWMLSKCHQYQQTLCLPRAKLLVCALVYGGLTMDGICNLGLVLPWFLWARCCSLYNNCKTIYDLFGVGHCSAWHEFVPLFFRHCHNVYLASWLQSLKNTVLSIVAIILHIAES
jgi:hypothetical protein